MTSEKGLVSLGVSLRLLFYSLGYVFLAVFLCFWTDTMSSSRSDEESVMSDDSDYNYIPGVYETNYETFENENATGGNESGDEGAVGPYADEPLADQEWLEEYRKKREEKEQRLSKLRDRLDGTVGVSSW